MQTSIQHRWFYQHSPEVVWDYLTRPELIAQWLMNNNFEPVVGHDFEFRANPMPDHDFDGIIYCKVLELVACQKLTYSWKLGAGNGRITVDSIVHFTLIPKDGGTELLLFHDGFKEANFSIVALMDQGWISNMKKIAKLIPESI